MPTPEDLIRRWKAAFQGKQKEEPTVDPYAILAKRQRDKNREKQQADSDTNMLFMESKGQRTAWSTRIQKDGNRLGIPSQSHSEFAVFMGTYEKIHGKEHADGFFEWLQKLRPEHVRQAVALAVQFRFRRSELARFHKFWQSHATRQSNLESKYANRKMTEEDRTNRIVEAHLENLSQRAQTIRPHTG